MAQVNAYIAAAQTKAREALDKYGESLPVKRRAAVLGDPAAAFAIQCMVEKLSFEDSVKLEGKDNASAAQPIRLYVKAADATTQDPPVLVGDEISYVGQTYFVADAQPEEKGTLILYWIVIASKSKGR